ncbi:MAG: tyrosine--tRNA ligase [Candidatus Gastranaerophilales bacterium]|nr:tyrosine--tRNA ligase [Candidatus Gastranaerophilales bacterium]
MEKTEIKQEFIEQAQSLSRGTEILPDGIMGLALKLQKAKENNKPLRVKLGLDPTRPDLHLGHSVVMRKLRQFQELGHQVVLIVGGATAMIGDPSGKSETRPSLTKEQVEENAQSYFEQMGRIVDVSKAEVLNNADWLHKMGLTELLGLSSKMTVAQMLVRDDFQKRYQENKPISIHEFFYPLMQAYDSVAIDSDIELGGTDQRFNVLLGRDIQAAYGKKDPQMVMLLPLLEGTDGMLKMSKTYPEHCISLTEEPKNMYGKLMSISDELIYRYFELLTEISDTELLQVKADLANPQFNPRDLKMKLAKTIVNYYYDEQTAQEAQDEFVNVVQKKGVPQDIPEVQKNDGALIIDIVLELGFVQSKGEAKRLIQGGGIKINGEKVCAVDATLDYKGETSVVLQSGKRNFAKLVKI